MKTIIIVSSIFLSLLLPTSYAVCCGATVACPVAGTHFLYCSDCANKDAFSCCGNGACNIFCCNCDNGCKGSCNARCGDRGLCQCSNSKRQQNSDDIERERLETLEYVRTLDDSNDWRIDFDEFTDFIIERYQEFVATHNATAIVVTQVLDAIKMRNEFDKLDTNGNGYLEFSEIDSALE